MMHLVKWLCFLCVFAVLTSRRAAGADDPAPADIRLRTPIKVVRPGAGPGGINVETENWGFINLAGELVIPPQWDDAAEFHEGLARVKTNGKSGFIDVSGKVVVPLEYDNWSKDGTDGFSEGLAAVRQGDNWGYIDRTGKIAVPLQWEDAGSFHEGLAAVKRHGKWGYIDHGGKGAVEPRWDEADAFEAGLAPVWRLKRKGFIDRHGKFLPRRPGDRADRSPEAWQQRLHAARVGSFCEGLAQVRLKREGPTGFINPRGKIVIPPRWYLGENFSEGLAAVKSEPNRGVLIDKTGQPVFEPHWSYDSFHDGLCEFTDEYGGFLRSGVMDRTGRIIVPSQAQWWGFKFVQGYILANATVEEAQGPSYAWYDRTGRKIWQSGPQPTPVADPPK